MPRSPEGRADKADPMTTEQLRELGQVNHFLRTCTNDEARQRLLDRLDAVVKRGSGQRKAEFDCSGEGDPPATGRGVNVRALYKRPAKNDEERAVAAALDRHYLLGEIPHKDPRETHSFRQLLDEEPSLRKSLDTSSGADWIPVEFSASFHEKVRLQMEVVGLL